MIDVKDIKRVYQIFLHDGIDTVEMQNGEDKISFSIGSQTVASKKTGKENENASSNVPAAAAPSAEAQQAIDTPASNVYELRSNWIGFFTRLNPKTGESYIKLRDIVKENEIVGHVRVLGVLQDLRSEKKGKLKEVLIEEGQPIEYGQPVMRFEVE